MFFSSLKPKLDAEIVQSFVIVWEHLGKPGSWWTGEERIAIANEIRSCNPKKLWDKDKPLESYAKQGDEILTPYIKAVVRMISNETASITEDIYREITEEIGEDKYAELAALISQVVPIDHLSDALGVQRETLPEVRLGSPLNERPSGLVNDVGFLPTFPADNLPHVAISLSLAQADNARRMLLVRAMYSGASFGDMIWNHRHLSRPQIELVAARTSALNECFY
tara:strand:+ start:893 stop:1564 length:672 start_codon:yes stop_codon:yes gene_type:complete